MRPSKIGADLVAQELGDEPVDRLALGRHGAPLGRRDLRGDLRQLCRIDVGQAIAAELQRADQRAMDDQIGIAADRRGEMRIAAQVEAEMAVVLRRIFGLRLRAQHDFVDDVLVLACLSPAARMPLNWRGVSTWPFANLMPTEARNSRKRIELFDRRLVMRAIDQRLARLFERLGRGDIGEDHEFLDQPVRFEPRRQDHAVYGAVRLQHDLALGQIEIERRAFFARVLQRRDKRQRAAVSTGSQQRLCVLVGRAVRGGLRLRIGELGGGAHQDAMKLCASARGRRGDR